jgi:hypothetical protein
MSRYHLLHKSLMVKSGLQTFIRDNAFAFIVMQNCIVFCIVFCSPLNIGSYLTSYLINKNVLKNNEARS